MIPFGVWRLAFGVRRSALGARRSALGARRSAFGALEVEGMWFKFTTLFYKVMIF
jgi:hypothetical protein